MLPLTWTFLVQLLKKELLMVEVWIKGEENQPQGIMLYLCLLFLSAGLQLVKLGATLEYSTTQAFIIIIYYIYKQPS